MSRRKTMAERGGNGRNFWGVHGGSNLAIIAEERWCALAVDAS